MMVAVKKRLHVSCLKYVDRKPPRGNYMFRDIHVCPKRSSVFWDTRLNMSEYIACTLCRLKNLNPEPPVFQRGRLEFPYGAGTCEEM